MVNDDNDNFLDEDELETVSSNLYDWIFDQVIVVGLPAIPDEERKPINWNCPDPLYTTKAIRYIAKEYEISFSVATQSAVRHGFPIFQHKYSDTITMISNLDDAAVTNNFDDYIDHLVYKPVIGKEIRRLTTVIDSPSAELMGNTASILGTSRSHLAGMCILLSLCTGDLVTDMIKTKFQKHVSAFETGMKMYGVMATNLI